jgi:hypothetical protein
MSGYPAFLQASVAQVAKRLPLQKKKSVRTKLYTKEMNTLCVICSSRTVTLILLTSTKWWAPASASKWQMGFNSAFKGLT